MDKQGGCVLDAGLGEEEVVGVVGEDAEEEPAEPGEVDDDPRRHGHGRRPGGRRGGGGGPCAHLTLADTAGENGYMWQTGSGRHTPEAANL